MLCALHCMKAVSIKTMCGSVFHILKKITRIIKHPDEKKIRTTQDLAKLLCDMVIMQLRVLCLYS